MAFPTGTDDTTFTAAMWNAVVAYFNGSASAGSNPISLITLNDAVNAVLTLKNLDTTTGRVLQLYKADGTSLLKVTKDGVRFSVDGITADQTPAVLSAVQTFAAAQTFASKVTLHRATSTASASTLTLPTDGNIVPITGTTTITGITATGLSGLPITLEFQSDGCTVKAGSTLRLRGDFISVAGGTLTLECDGTNWSEVARGACRVPGSKYHIFESTQSIASGSERTVSWTNQDYNYGMTTFPTSASVPGILGRWLVTGAIMRDDSTASGLRGFLLKNGSDDVQLFGSNNEDIGTGRGGYPFATVIEVTDVDDSYGLGLYTVSTQNIIGGGSDASHIEYTYLGR